MQVVVFILMLLGIAFLGAGISALEREHKKKYLEDLAKELNIQPTTKHLHKWSRHPVNNSLTCTTCGKEAGKIDPSDNNQDPY